MKLFLKKKPKPVSEPTPMSDSEKKDVKVQTAGILLGGELELAAACSAKGKAFAWVSSGVADPGSGKPAKHRVTVLIGQLVTTEGDSLDECYSKAAKKA